MDAEGDCEWSQGFASASSYEWMKPRDIVVQMITHALITRQEYFVYSCFISVICIFFLCYIILYFYLTAFFH